jgi:hypothetical protein
LRFAKDNFVHCGGLNLSSTANCHDPENRFVKGNDG